MRKRSSSTNAKTQVKAKKASPLPRLNHLSTPKQRGRKAKSSPSMDPLAFLSSTSASSSKRGRKMLSPSSPITLKVSPVSSPKTLSTIADLRNLAASRTESLKRQLDLCHSDAMKELDASQVRISKRCKTQTQACLHLTEDIDKEYKKMSDRIVENTELIKNSYKEFIEDAQAAAARLSKVSFSDLAKSTEKSLNGLRTRYKIPTTL
ncbi:Kinesin-like protein [Rhynchospora pubera]|uniref:Kinesin-like protein n=1 Tax=Rhynchospora pubera TaxID=906938 RepID=A0AAV8F2U2_9POAL|nr:Kinesin-like protein [Rhynchospora pubera]